jgi:hypothetical protein
VTEPTKLSPSKTGQALVEWRNDQNADRPSEIDVICALGCLFELYIVSSGVGDWVVVDDSFGQSLGVRHKSNGWINHPLDVITKRTKTGSAAELLTVYDVFKDPPAGMGE